MSNTILLSETNNKISELKKFKRKLVKSIISDECPFKMGDRVLVRNENDVTIMVGVIISIKVICNSMMDYYFTYTIQGLNPLYGSKIQQRLEFDKDTMSLTKMF